MSKIRIDKITKKEEKKKPIEKTITWYDSFYKKMRTFKCTELRFVYKKEKFVIFPDGTKKPENETTEEEKDEYGVYSTNMLRPEEVTHYKKTIDEKSNLSFIEKWIRNNDGEITDKDNKEIVVEIPRNLLNNFTDDLDHERIEYDILEK